MPRKNEILNIGDSAPLFTLQSAQREAVSLESYRNKQHVILAFFPGHMVTQQPTPVGAIYKLTSMNMPISAQQLSVPLGNGLAKSAGMLRATISLFHY